MTQTRRFAHLNYHAPLGRLGGAAGLSLQAAGFRRVHDRVAHYADTLGLYTFLTTDDNDHALNKPHPRARLLARDGIDKVWLIPPRRKADRDALTVEALRVKVVELTIDGHNAVGVQLRISGTSGLPRTFWLAQCNLGRGETPEAFRLNAERVRAGYPGPALIGFDEIDEADRPDEHMILREVFRLIEGYALSGWGTMVPAVVLGLTLAHPKVTAATPGMRKVTPARTITESVLTW